MKLLGQLCLPIVSFAETLQVRPNDARSYGGNALTVRSKRELVRFSSADTTSKRPGQALHEPEGNHAGTDCASRMPRSLPTK